MRLKNILALIGLGVVIYVLVKYVLPVIFHITMGILSIAFYVVIILLVLIVGFYLIGRISRRKKR